MNYYDAEEMTPLIKINNIYVKLEYYNVTGSSKDRVASYVVKRYLENKIKYDGIIVSTSGNLGISMAYFCHLNNIKCYVFMPKNASIEKINKIISFKAKIKIFDNLKIANQKAFRYSQLLNLYYFDQFNDETNSLSYYETLGEEIIKQQEKKIDFLVLGIGSGGSLSGLSKKILSKYKNCKIIGVLPESENIDGLNNEFVPFLLNDVHIDKIIKVKRNDAINSCKELNKLGYKCGISSGATYYVSNMLDKNKCILTIFYDTIENYLSVVL